jgi:transposase
MTPRLPPSMLEMLSDMILSKSLNTSQMAEAAECGGRSIINICNNLHRFGNVRIPPTRVGRRRRITPAMLEAICDHLIEKAGLYVDEMALFIWDEFHTKKTNSSLKRALTSIGWSKKVARQRAKEQNAELRDLYLHNMSDFRSYHLVYVDESGFVKGSKEAWKRPELTGGRGAVDLLDLQSGQRIIRRRPAKYFPQSKHDVS